jgi:hypothetical protein
VLLLASLLSSLVARTLGLLLKLELLKLLGDVNIHFFFLLFLIIILLVVMIFHHLGLLLLKKTSCAAFLLVLLLHHLLLELNALEDGRGIGLAWKLGPFFVIIIIITEWLWVTI